MIDIGSDAGLFVAAILLQLPETLNKRVVASGGYLTPDEAVATFTEVTGKKAVYNQLPWVSCAGHNIIKTWHVLTNNFAGALELIPPTQSQGRDGRQLEAQ